MSFSNYTFPTGNYRVKFSPFRKYPKEFVEPFLSTLLLISKSGQDITSIRKKMLENASAVSEGVLRSLREEPTVKAPEDSDSSSEDEFRTSSSGDDLEVVASGFQNLALYYVALNKQTDVEAVEEESVEGESEDELDLNSGRPSPPQSDTSSSSEFEEVPSDES